MAGSPAPLPAGGGPRGARRRPCAPAPAAACGGAALGALPALGSCEPRRRRLLCAQRRGAYANEAAAPALLLAQSGRGAGQYAKHSSAAANGRGGRGCPAAAGGGAGTAPPRAPAAPAGTRRDPPGPRPGALGDGAVTERPEEPWGAGTGPAWRCDRGRRRAPPPQDPVSPCPNPAFAAAGPLPAPRPSSRTTAAKHRCGATLGLVVRGDKGSSRFPCPARGPVLGDPKWHLPERDRLP